jgi:hypothetical protein
MSLLPFTPALLLSTASLVLIPAQSSATLQGRVFDAAGAVLPGAVIRVHDDATGFDRSATSDGEGRYHFAAIPVGTYEIAASAPGFKAAIIPEMPFEVGRTLVRDFRLELGDTTETVVVTGELPLVDQATTSVGHILTSRSVQEIPLNGRHFIDLALLAPGSVAPSQTGFSTTPIRGIGSVAINTAGNREEASGFTINGVSAHNLAFGSLGFQAPIGSIQEFKVDNSPVNAEYGHVSGAMVNLVTRSGSNEFHGDVFEFFRNDALDARNFFEFTSPAPHPFERNQFGGSLGGPLIRDTTFFFAAYEGLRQRQGLDINSLVLSDEQRATDDPLMRRLIELIPRANFIDAGGTPRFVGSASARVETDHWTVDISQNAGRNDRLHAFYGGQRIRSWEPTTGGNSIPGFGSIGKGPRSLLTLGETHMFGATAVNEARFGRNALGGTLVPASALNPAQFGIRNGVDRTIGLPQLVVAGGLNFGGPANFPAGRDDVLYVLGNTLTVSSGAHSVRLGGEYRRFISTAFSEGTGAFNFPSVPAFLSGTANAFTITLGERRSQISQRALGLFALDRVTIHPRVTLDLGLRYEWHVTPTERDDKFVIFDPRTVSLLRVGVDVEDDIYEQNNRNIEPRAGIVWDPSGDGRTLLRAVYGLAVDQPSTTVVSGTVANPPFARPLTAAGAIPLDSAIERTQATALAPTTVDRQFRNASVASWNVNVQQRLARTLAAMIGYFGSRGRHLRISRNINQPADGTRPYPPCRPRAPFSRAHRSATLRRSRAPGFPATTRSGLRSCSGCDTGSRSTPHIRSRSRSTPTRSTLPGSPFRTRTTFPTSMGCRTSTRVTASSSARSTSCPAADTGWRAAGSWPRSSSRRAAILSTSSPAPAR